MKNKTKELLKLIKDAKINLAYNYCLRKMVPCKKYAMEWAIKSTRDIKVYKEIGIFKYDSREYTQHVYSWNPKVYKWKYL